MRPHTSADEAHRIAFGFSPPVDLYFATRLRDGLGEGAHAPPIKDRAAAARLASRGSGRLRDMPRRTQGGAPGSWSRQHGRRFSKTERRSVANSAITHTQDFGNGVAHGRHQPISGRMEHETDLVGLRRTATGAIGGELCLMQLDQVFGLAARAIRTVVDPLGRADIEAGDDEADVEAEHCHLNTGDRSCPPAWCSWRWGTAFAGKSRAGQLAIAGRLTVGSSLNGAMVSSVM